MRNPLCIYCQRREEERDEAWADLSREKRRRIEAEAHLQTATYDRDQLALALAASQRTNHALTERVNEMERSITALTRALKEIP